MRVAKTGDSTDLHKAVKSGMIWSEVDICVGPK